MDTSKEVINSDDTCMDTTNNESACIVASEEDIGDTLMDTSVTPDAKSSSGWEGISNCSSIEVSQQPLVNKLKNKLNLSSISLSLHFNLLTSQVCWIIKLTLWGIQRGGFMPNPYTHLTLVHYNTYNLKTHLSSI